CIARPISSTIDLRELNTTNDPNGNIYLGLAYTIIVALMTVVLGTLFLREPRGVKIWHEVGGEEPGMVTEATPAERRRRRRRRSAFTSRHSASGRQGAADRG